MTATGTLYVDETCRDFFEKKLDRWYGKGNWYLDGDEFGDIWDLSEMPDFMIIDVKDENDKKIGKVEIKNKFEVVHNAFGNDRYVECNPKSIKRLKSSPS